jgi:hypothetical protein
MREKRAATEQASRDRPLGAAVIAQFERRLVELGCPIRELRSRVLEIADHYEDLKESALGEGLGEPEAEAQASRLLGEPVALAERMALALRQASWWGRHRIIGFCFLPPVATLVVSVAGVVAIFGLLQIYFSAEEWAVLRTNGFFQSGLVIAAIQGASGVSIALIAIVFSWVAHRSVCGLRWALAACVACSLHSYFCGCRVSPHALELGYHLSPSWICWTFPLLVAAVIVGRQKRLEGRLAPLPIEKTRARADRYCPRGSFAPPKLPRLRKCCATPTYWVVALLVMGITALALWGRAVRLGAVAAERVRAEELRDRIWPAERAAALARIRAGQLTKGTTRETTINLGRWVNAPLPDKKGLAGASGEGRANATDDGQADLPAGVHTFGGVPFDVQGRVQLMGRGLSKVGRFYPSKALGIQVARRCERVHLLHGASCVSVEDAVSRVGIARLVLHYADGSARKLGIVAGEHVLDWWGPIVKTGVADGQTSGASTELAWAEVDTEPALSRPGGCFRLYQTTFANPQPELELLSIDYESTMTNAAPFLVGLTVD